VKQWIFKFDKFHVNKVSNVCMLTYPIIATMY